MLSLNRTDSQQDASMYPISKRWNKTCPDVSNIQTLTQIVIKKVGQGINQPKGTLNWDKVPIVVEILTEQITNIIYVNFKVRRLRRRSFEGGHEKVPGGLRVKRFDIQCKWLIRCAVFPTIRLHALIIVFDRSAQPATKFPCKPALGSGISEKMKTLILFLLIGLAWV